LTSQSAKGEIVLHMRSSAPQRKHLLLASLSTALLVLAGCAAVPTIPEPPELDSGATVQQIRLRGARGPLSKRETARVLRHFAGQAPDADAFARHLAIEQAVVGTPLYTGNRVTILRDGPQTFAAMFDAIRHAQHYLYLEYFILEDVHYGAEQLSDLLISRHRQGVQIDVIYDAIGSFSTPDEFFHRLRAAGIRVREFNPIDPLTAFTINDRDHRKILVADGSTAIVGGVNLSTTYQSVLERSGSGRRHRLSTPTTQAGPAAPHAPAPLWHDTDIQIDGPAVRDLKHLFEQHWRQQGGAADALAPDGGPIAPQGDQVVRIIGSEGGQLLPRYYATLLSAIRSATSRIWVTAAYFVPTRQEREALVRAARRGVDVRLLLPARSDSKAALAVQRSYYSGLLRNGVKIYERDDGMLHSKTTVMDGVWSIVGSSNFDHRSVLFNDEVDAVVIGARTGNQLEQYFLQDLKHARRIDLATWRQRPLGDKFKGYFWRIWQQLL
jgi:cardiolipin synthase